MMPLRLVSKQNVSKRVLKPFQNAFRGIQGAQCWSRATISGFKVYDYLFERLI